MKFNPFKPNAIVNSGMFSGRMTEVYAIEQSLHQTRNGSPKHFIIEGERGIGKSSLLFYIQMLAAGDLAMSDAELDFQFLVLSVELSEGVTYLDLIQKIGNELKRQLGRMHDVKLLAKTAWDFISNWSVLGVEYKKDHAGKDTTQAIEDLAQTMADIVKSASAKLASKKQLDGILLLIDEADKPSEQARLGEFCKLFTERLTKIGCSSVCIGLAGLPSLLPKLRASHESSPRVFDILTLLPINDEDAKYVVTRGLKEANEKNSVETTINDDALSFIAKLSEGYPHFIQQFAYSAFQEDLDNCISLEDVRDGAYNTGGALDQLGKRYFDEMYFVKIWSDDYRRVLHAMADKLDGWNTKSDISKKSGIKDSQVNNAFSSLKNKNIIIPNPQKPGEYRLPTKSFAVWIKAIESKREAAANKS